MKITTYFNRVFNRRVHNTSSPIMKIHRENMAKYHRNYAAAAQDRLTYSWRGTNLTSDEMLRWQLPTMRARSRDLAENNEYVKRFLKLVCQNVIGHTGITYQNRAADGKKLDTYANRLIEDAWKDWGRLGSCTLDGEFSWKGFQSIAMVMVARDGEAIIKIVNSEYNKYHFSLQLLEADLLDTQYNFDLPNGNYIRLGIEYNKDGRRVAYHLLKKHPGSNTLQTTLKTREYERIPAAEIIHLYIKERPTQSRGVPWVFASMRKLKDIGAYDQAHIIAARIGAAKMGFFTRTGDSEYRGDGEDADGNLITNAEPGTFENLPPGVDFKEFDPDYPSGNYEPFMKAALHGVASGLNVAYASLSNDLKDVNYSSARIGLLDERDGWKAIQGWFIDHACNTIHDKWLNLALMGIIPLPSSKFEKFRQCSWRGRGWTWVDPEKEIKASVQGIENYLTTLQDQLAERGLDMEEVLQQRAYELQRIKELGLPLPERGNQKPGGNNESGKDNQSTVE